ncbi:MAG: phosphodiester glycosidase family protein [bacterium]
MSDAHCAVLTGIRNMSDPKNVKIVLELDGDAEVKDFILRDPARLVVDLSGVDSPLVPYTAACGDTLLTGIRASRFSEGTVRVVLDVAHLMPYFVKKTHGGVEIYVRRSVAEEHQSQQLARGMVYTRAVEMHDWGILTYHIVEVDLRRGGYRVGMETAEGALGALETLSSVMKRTGALLGVNGGYFDMKTGMPIDMLISEGVPLTLPDRYRGFLGIGADGSVNFLHPTAGMNLDCGGGESLYVHSLNRAPDAMERAVFTAAYGANERPDGKRTEYVVRGGVVREVRAAGGAIPADGFVLSVNEGAVYCGGGQVRAGSALKQVFTSYPDLSGIRYGFSAGPMLVENGNARHGIIEDFSMQSKIVSERNPRTAIGLNNDNNLFIIVVEGRSVWSAGLYLDELAELMAANGVRTGMNLDGGGSSEIIFNGRILNRLSEGKERPINNAVLIFN